MVFLDGINEYHVTEAQSPNVRTRLWDLFSWLDANSLKAVVSCRSFTWSRVFADDALLQFMFLAKRETISRSEQFFNPRTGRLEERTVRSEKLHHGAELLPFSDAQRCTFWQGVREQLPAVDWHNESIPSPTDPFVCGLLARQALAGRPAPNDNEDLILEEYIDERCRDKGSAHESLRRKTA